MQTHDTHNISNSSSSNNYYEGQKKQNPKLILYKQFNENKKNNLYYYNEDNEENQTKTLKNGNHQYINRKNSLTNGFDNINNSKNNVNNRNNNNKNGNNKNYKIKNENNKNDINKNDDNKTDNNNKKNQEISNNEFPKKLSIINYVSKGDKSKNLFIFKGNRNGFNMINSNRDKDNRFIKGIKFKNKDNYYDNDDDFNEQKFTTPKFDIQKLINKKANQIKIISEKKIELPIVARCYFNKCIIKCEKRFKLPISNLCYLNKSTIFTVEKLKLPFSDICHFNKSYIVKEIKFRNTIITDYYFCTKEKKEIEKKDKSYIIENCIEFDFIKKIELKKNNKNEKKNDKNKNNINDTSNKNLNNSKSKKQNVPNTPIFKYTPKPKKKDKESEKKFSEYQKKMNKRLKSYKTIKYEDITKKIKKEPIKNQNLKINSKNNSIKIKKNNTIKTAKSTSLKFNKYFIKNTKRNNNNDSIKVNKKVSINDEKSNSMKRKIKNENNYSIKSKLYKSDSFPRKKIKTYVVSKTENKNNLSRSEEKEKYLNSSISLSKANIKTNNIRTNNNNNNLFKYSFYSLFDVNSRRNNDSGYEDTYHKNKKKILQRFIENGQNKNNKRSKDNEKSRENQKNKEKEKYHNRYLEKEKEKNNKIIMPKINDNMNTLHLNRQTPKSRTIITTQSSRFLIKKINSSSFKNRNGNVSLFNITKKQNNLINTHENNSDLLKEQIKNNTNSNIDLPGLMDNKHIMNNNEFNHNHTKYDRHFGNEINCPKCQSMDIKINYLKEKKNEVIPNINSYGNNNSFNKTIDDYKRDNIILPFKYFGKLYLKNYNNYRNNSKNFLSKLQRNNSVIQIRKVNISKYSEQLLKNYKSNFLAIKEYFNIK